MQNEVADRLLLLLLSHASSSFIRDRQYGALSSNQHCTTSLGKREISFSQFRSTITESTPTKTVCLPRTGRHISQWPLVAGLTYSNHLYHEGTNTSGARRVRQRSPRSARYVRRELNRLVPIEEDITAAIDSVPAKDLAARSVYDFRLLRVMEN